MDNIRIKNVRGLVDTKDIDIKPVTILLGRNGSGKSSFARCFPLMKQSCVENKKNPLVFNGQYVDFGDYNTAKSMFGGDIFVSFSINPKDIESEIIPSYLFDYVGEECLSYRIKFSATGERDNYISKICISSKSYKISLTVSESLRIREAKINGIDCSEFLSEFSIVPGMIVPMLCEGKRRVPFMWLSETSTPVKAFVDIVREHCHQRVSKGSILSMIYKFTPVSNREILDFLKGYELGQVWRSKVQGWTVKKLEFLRIRKILLSVYAFRFMAHARVTFELAMDNVEYLAPLRAMVQRYYRFDDSPVFRVSHDGSNVALFFHGMSDEDREKFTNWTQKYFKIQFASHSAYGHVSLFVSLDGETPQNVVDSGFGYSQVLPVLLQMWSTLRPDKRSTFKGRVKKIIVIEQPELHMHPCMESLFADVVFTLAKSQDSHFMPHFIIETHSKEIVNRIGENIVSSPQMASEVALLLFEKKENGKSAVTRTEYSAEGYIKDWPVGFLSAE